MKRISNFFGVSSEREDEPLLKTNNSDQNPHSVYIPEGNAGNGEGEEEDNEFTKSSVPRTKWETLRKRVPYYIPVLNWLPKYKLHDLPHDFLAGLTVGIMLIPQALSYAGLVGIPPVNGLYAGCIPLLVFAFFGTSRQLAIGPEALVSIVAGNAISIVYENPTVEELVVGATLLGFLVGVFTLLLGLLRFGFLAEILSRPLVRGYVSAIGLTIIVEQLDSLTGIDVGNAKTWRKVPVLLHHMSSIQYATVLLGIGTIAFLLLFEKMKSKLPVNHSKFSILIKIVKGVPGILIVVIFGIVLAKSLKLNEKGMAILGLYPKAFPPFKAPHLGDLKVITEFLEPAIIISIVGFVESMAIANQCATTHNYVVSPNRELVALGMSNIIGSFFGSWPIFGALTRTIVNNRTGARTQLAGFITGSIIFIVAVFFTPLFEFLPKVVMSGIVVVAAINLIEIHDIIFLVHLRSYVDLVLLLLTCAFTFLFGAEVGLLIAVGASLFLVIRQTTLPKFAILGQIKGSHDKATRYKDVMEFPKATPIPSILMIRIDENLYFANMGKVKELFSRIEKLGNPVNHPTEELINSPLKAIIIDASNIPNIDAPSIQILLEMIVDYKSRGIKVAFVKLRDNLKEGLLRGGIIQMIGSDNFFSSMQNAIDYINGNTDITGYSTYRHM